MLGLIEELQDNGPFFYEEILKKHDNDSEFLYQYGCFFEKNNNEKKKLLKQSADLGLDIAQFDYAEILWNDFENLDKSQIDDCQSIVAESLKYYQRSIKSGLHFMQARYAKICLILIKDYSTYAQSTSEEEVFKNLSKAFDQEPEIYLKDMTDLYEKIGDQVVKNNLKIKLLEIARKYCNKDILENESIENIIQLIKNCIEKKETSSPKKNNIEKEEAYEMRISEKAAKKGNPFAAFRYGMMLSNSGDSVGAKGFFKIPAELGISRAQVELALCDLCLENKALHEALDWLEKAAKNKNLKAQKILGELYYTGTKVDKDYEKAVKCFIEAAKLGNEDAKHKLGICYYNGHGVLQNYELAAKNFEDLAKKGHAESQYSLGLCYIYGHGVPQNYELAAKNFEDLAKKGYAESQYNLGFCYIYGHGVPQNYIEAVKWFQKAADQKLVNAQHNLGVCYSNGWGVPKNYIEAVKWFQKAADQKYKESQNNLGFCYYKGLGVNQNYFEAVKWFQEAEKQGSESSQFNLGLCYANGYGVTQNYEKASEWFKKAADQGYGEAFKRLEELATEGNILAQYNLGLCYRNGQGVEQNHAKAFEYFQKSADQECNKYVLTNIAILYFYGWGVIQDDEMALNIFAIAAEDGNEEAMYFLGHMFLNGCGIDKDSQKAVDFFKKSSEKEFFPALYTMGVFFEEGKYIDKDPNKANEFYKKAFEQFPRQYNTFSEFYSHIMGEMYEYGRGVEKNIAEALKWYERGAKQNHPASQRAIERCNNSSSLNENTHTL